MASPPSPGRTCVGSRVAWAKLRAMVEGAELASDQLWEAAATKAVVWQRDATANLLSRRHSTRSVAASRRHGCFQLRQRSGELGHPESILSAAQSWHRTVLRRECVAVNAIFDDPRRACLQAELRLRRGGES